MGEFRRAATVDELLSEESARIFAGILPADQPVEWEVYVPPSYAADRPAGPSSSSRRRSISF